MRWYCPSCGHHHGRENCTAITHPEDNGARRCGCTDHKENQHEQAA
jgi:hypothetical protein